MHIRGLKYYFCILTLILFVVFSGCNKDEDNNIHVIDYGYFPADTGHWVTYYIEEINIDADVDVYDTSRYYIKEVIESEFIDNENRPALRIERYTRENDTMSWEIKDIWYANLLTASAQKVEENIRYVKLTFPVVLYNAWDGNAYNTYSAQEYQITNLDSAETINDIYLDSVLTVLQRDDESLIEKYYAVEKYAKNIGLVYKNEINIEYAIPDPGIPIEDRISVGTLYTQTITGYGPE